MRFGPLPLPSSPFPISGPPPSLPSPFESPMGFIKSFFGRRQSDSSATSPIGSPTPMLASRIPSVNSRDQIAELEQVFKKFDVNGDGKISAAELGSILGTLSQPASDEELRRMIKEVDSDGDGFLDLKEFIELNTKGIDSGEALENLRDAFSVYDIDGNGSITAEELHEVMRSLGDECSLAECRRMICGVDKNGDGVISFDEFKIMMMAGSRLIDFNDL